MYRRLTYALERCLERGRLRSLCLEGVERAALFHLSTPDHLALFLEHVLTWRPQLSIHVFTHLGMEGALREIPSLTAWQEAFPIRLSGPADLADAASKSRPPEIAALLYSAKAVVAPAVGRRLRRAFTVGRAGRKIVIHGDGSIWKGDLVSRGARRAIRPLLAWLAPQRDREEERILRKRMLPDPGYDKNAPPAVTEVCRHTRRRVLLRAPLRVEQCLETGTILKPDLLTEGRDDTLYEGEYHGAALFDERRDWQALLERSQDTRWRRMERVGVGSAESFGSPRPRALDIGCGTGVLSDKLTRQGFETLGIDCSRTAVEKARASFPRTRFAVATIGDLAARGERYDLLVLSHVLEHVSDDVAFLASLQRLMRPTSRLYIEVPWADAEPLRARPGWRRQRDHCREYTQLGLYRLVAGSGFTVLSHAESFHDEEDPQPYQFLLARLRSPRDSTSRSPSVSSSSERKDAGAARS
jgi:SAM-dependent methyltransferase